MDEPQGKRKREDGEEVNVEDTVLAPSKKPTLETIKSTTLITPSTKKVIATTIVSKPASKTTVITRAQPSISSFLPSTSFPKVLPSRYPPAPSTTNKYDDEDAAPLPVFTDGTRYGSSSSSSSTYAPSPSPPTITSFGSSFNRPSFTPSSSFQNNIATATAAVAAVASQNTDGKKTIKRMAAGEEWEDPTLMEWPDNDYRIFVGDLGPEVNDEMLKQAFMRFPSFQKAKVVRDKRTMKTKGFGFVSFLNPLDFAHALREMNGKYIGNRPVKLRKSRWQDRNKE